MLKANLDAQIDAKHKELEQIIKDIQRMNNLINGLTKQLEILKSNKREVLYKIEELEDELEDGTD